MIHFIGIYPSSVLKKNPLNHGAIWEIMYCLEGRGTMITGGERVEYAAGQIIVQPPDTLHCQTKDTDSCDLYLMTDDEYPFSGRLTLMDTADGDIKSLLMLIYRLNIGAMPGRGEVDLMLMNAIVALIRMYSASTMPAVVYEMENEIIRNISNSLFSVSDMYQKLYMSEDAARAQFKQAIGCSPHEYLTRLRIQQACRMFERFPRDGTISEIAQRVGVTDPQYFSRLFKQQTGLSPNAWIKAHAQKDGQDSINTTSLSGGQHDD